jgi:hypothetical protein
MLHKIKVAALATVIAGTASAAFARTAHHHSHNPGYGYSADPGYGYGGVYRGTDEGGGRINTGEPGGNAGS